MSVKAWKGTNVRGDFLCYRKGQVCQEDNNQRRKDCFLWWLLVCFSHVHLEWMRKRKGKINLQHFLNWTVHWPGEKYTWKSHYMPLMQFWAAKMYCSICRGDIVHYFHQIHYYNNMKKGAEKNAACWSFDSSRIHGKKPFASPILSGFNFRRAEITKRHVQFSKYLLF